MKQHLTLPQLPKQDQSGNINQQELIHFLSAIQRILSDKQREDYEAYSSISSISMEQIEQHIIEKLYPIGERYIQLPEPDGTFSSAKSPEVKFGGEWVCIFDDEGVFFKTEGYEPANFYKNNVLTSYRTNGLSEDKMQRLYGRISFKAQPQWGREGVFASSYTYAERHESGKSGGQMLIFNSTESQYARTTTDTAGRTEPTNRLMRIWERVA